MILERFLGVLKNANALQVGDWFIYLIIAVFIVAVLLTMSHRHSKFEHLAPSVLTTLGILGTFVGIAIGLANFDSQPDKMQNSIELLLEGLKTAFLTSVFGIGLSIVARSISAWADRSGDEGPAEVTPNDIHQALVGIRSEVVTANETLEKTRLSIAGDGDASVVTQIQKMRTQVQDASAEARQDLRGLRQDVDAIGLKVAEEFRQFAEKVSEIGSKQLIEALEEVIRDFNQKITEQFGDNFKRLDASVGKLVEWQAEYKEQIQQLDTQFKEALKGLLISRDAVARIAEHSADIPRTMQGLSAIMRAAQAQLDDLQRHLEAFADIRDKAVDAFPQIQTHVDTVMTQMRDSVKSASSHYEIMLTDSAELIQKFKESGDEVHQRFVDETGTAVQGVKMALDNAGAQLEQGGERMQVSIESAAKTAETAFDGAKDSIDGISKDLRDSIQMAFDNQNQRIQQLVGGLKEAVDEAAGDQTELIQKLANSLDQAMQEELQRAMEIMGNGLSSITGKFVDDYTDLTGHMQKVIENNRTLV